MHYDEGQESKRGRKRKAREEGDESELQKSFDLEVIKLSIKLGELSKNLLRMG